MGQRAGPPPRPLRSPPLVSSLGDIIRRQRELHEFSLRQLADLAGISNPYLSQIEHGMRAPSEAVLGGIARALNVPVETLYRQAGLRPRDDDEDTAEQAVIDAIHADPRLTAARRRSLIEIYRAFVDAPPRPGRP
jgi:transcriptional regulator with XRE-family HTH domain